MLAPDLRGGVKSVTVKVSALGRFHLPSAVRKALGLKGPGHVIITLEDGQARLTTVAENLARIRALARPYAPKNRLVSEELIAERRDEARLEEAAPPASARKPGEKQDPGRPGCRSGIALAWRWRSPSACRR
jgi:bifunctional DNA-binding transcriptional regulator/antitoxin component of YhaV-PrlF toxin-antitoxin module